MGYKSVPVKERLRTLVWSSLEKRRPRGNLIALYNFLRRGSGEGCAKLFSLVTCVIQEWHRAELGEVQNRYQEKFLHREHVKTLEQGFIAWLLMPYACCHCSRGIWIMPSMICFNFWLALKMSGIWTRWSWKIPSN